MNSKNVTKSIAAGLIFTLAGCTTVNPYTEQQQTSNVVKGAGAGAIAGAIIGAMNGNRETALKGAVLGAGVGGGIGYYMDVQEAELRQRLLNTGVSVSRVGNDLILNMPGNITFMTGNANINAGFYQVLDSVAIILNEYTDTVVSIVGHTDSVGSVSSNQSLSEERAHSVAGYLRSQNVAGQRFNVRGNGEQTPVASNLTKQGRAQNRRVEITLTPLNVR